MTKRGKPAVIVVSVTEFERLNRKATRQRPSFVEHLLAFPQGGDDFKIERLHVKPRNAKF